MHYSTSREFKNDKHTVFLEPVKLPSFSSSSLPGLLKFHTEKQETPSSSSIATLAWWQGLLVHPSSTLLAFRQYISSPPLFSSVSSLLLNWLHWIDGFGLRQFSPDSFLSFFYFPPLLVFKYIGCSRIGSYCCSGCDCGNLWVRPALILLSDRQPIYDGKFPVVLGTWKKESEEGKEKKND